MITNDDENWHYLAVKSISALLKGITSNHVGDFYCLNYLHSYRAKETLKKHEKVCKDHDYCNVKMTGEDKKNIKIQPRRRVIKSSIHDLCWLRMFAWKNGLMCVKMILKNLLQKKKAKHMSSGYSWITYCSFDASKNEWGYYRGKDCMEML